jgi:hypothetical protein
MDSHPEVANDLEAKLRAILKGAPAKADEDGVVADAPGATPAATDDK